MDDQVDDEGDARIEVPPVERCWERQLRWCAPVPIHDARHEHVQRDDEEQEVRERKAHPPLHECPGPNDLVGHASEGPAALGQVHKHQTDEHEADIGVVGVAHMQKLERAKCGCA